MTRAPDQNAQQGPSASDSTPSSLLPALLEKVMPAVKIVDVGAMLLGETPYARLLNLPRTTLVAFEPGDEEREKLRQAISPPHVILPHVVGRGGPGVFRMCTWNATNSLYEPNTELLRRFTGMREAHVVAKRVEVNTVSLDDIPDARGMHYLKIDVQGAELDVIEGAPKTCESLLIAHVEVQFMPLYEGVPLHADVDLAMRKIGLRMHSMSPPGRGTFSPLRRKQGSEGGQWLWADALYVRDFMSFNKLEPEQLLVLALIAELGYFASDLALLALQHYDAKQGTNFHEAHCTQLLGQARVAEPL